MMKTKTFDCVAMKDAIQAKHAQEYAGMTPDEIANRIREKLAGSGHPVAVWYRDVLARKRTGHHK